MNLASWIILAVLVAVIALAVRATFFGKRKHGGCSGCTSCGDALSQKCPVRPEDGEDACSGCPHCK